MKRYSLFSLMSFAMCAVIVVANSTFAKAVAWLEDALSLFRPLNLNASAQEVWLDYAPAGAPLDAVLQNSMRHEAGVPRRSADRHI